MPERDEPPEGGGPDDSGVRTAFEWLCVLALLSVPLLIWLFATAN